MSQYDWSVAPKESKHTQDEANNKTVLALTPLRLTLRQHRRPPEPQGLVMLLLFQNNAINLVTFSLLRGLHTVYPSFRLGSLDCHNNQSFRYRDMQSGSWKEHLVWWCADELFWLGIFGSALGREYSNWRTTLFLLKQLLLKQLVVLQQEITCL